MPGATRKASASAPSGKGTGPMKEASRPPRWVTMGSGGCRASCQLQLPGPVPQRGWFADGRGLETGSDWRRDRRRPLAVSRRVTELPTETENECGLASGVGGVTKPTARGASEPPIPPCDPTWALTASASLTWSSMSLRAGGSPDAAHSGTVMTAGKRRLHPEENSASRGGVSSSRIAQNQDNALPGDDLLETWSLREAASL